MKGRPLAAKMKSLVPVCCLLSLLVLSAAGMVDDYGVWVNYFRFVDYLDGFEELFKKVLFMKWKLCSTAVGSAVSDQIRAVHEI